MATKKKTAKRKAGSKKTWHCSGCGKSGHNVRSCAGGGR